MARRRRTAAGLESLADLARKAEILERELAVQREALEKLRQLGSAPRKLSSDHIPATARKTA